MYYVQPYDTYIKMILQNNLTYMETQLGVEANYQHQTTKRFPPQPFQGSLQTSSVPKWLSTQNLRQHVLIIHIF
jgi:hypothetical protein